MRGRGARISHPAALPAKSSAPTRAHRQGLPGKRTTGRPGRQHALTLVQSANAAHPLEKASAQSRSPASPSARGLTRPSHLPPSLSTRAHRQHAPLAASRPQIDPLLPGPQAGRTRTDQGQQSPASASRRGTSPAPKIAQTSAALPRRVQHRACTTRILAQSDRPTSTLRRFADLSAHLRTVQARADPHPTVPADLAPAAHVQPPIRALAAHRQTGPDLIGLGLIGSGLIAHGPTAQARAVQARIVRAPPVQVPAAPAQVAPVLAVPSAAKAVRPGHSPPAAASRAPAALVPAASPSRVASPATKANPPAQNVPANPAERSADRGQSTTI